jgi:3-dehydroquinate synthase
MAEVIKYGVIWDQDLFEQLETTADLSYLEALPDRLLETIITRSCQAKVDVVTQDEKEAGLRAILNYGHTLGHAVESLTGYSQINHGEAVGIGMVAAGEIAVKMGLWSQTDCDRTLSLIEKTGLPTKIPTELKLEAILNTLQTDKKVKAGKVRFILPTAISEVMVSDDVTSEILESVLGSKDNG